MTMNAALKLLLDLPEQQTLAGSEQNALFSLPALIANLTYHAMMLEVHLTPKPGLVDTVNNGAHDDMTLNTFIISGKAITPYFEQFVQTGMAQAAKPAEQLLPEIRPIGIAAEAAMLQATGGVNTHKGMIFIMGLLCAAIGWLKGREATINVAAISSVIAAACANLVQDELATKSVATSAGERNFHQYGLTGARGEAASGLYHIVAVALPAYRRSLAADASTEQAMWYALLVLMAENNDSNLVSRGGIDGLRYVQGYAQKLLQQPLAYDALEIALRDFDKELIARHLSPGGSADLLAATWLIHEVAQMFSDN